MVRGWLPRVWPWLLAVLLLGPALSPGYVLSYDMVFVPDLALRPGSWGLGSALPRAVPSDAVVGLLDTLLPGALLQKVLLLAALVLAGSGAARLVPSAPTTGGTTARLVATTAYVWNPFVVERLGLGHWPLLLTYAALPWVVAEGRRLGRGEGSVARVLLWMALGSLSPAGGLVVVLAAVVAVAAARRGARPVVLTAVGGAVLNAPWVVAGALHGSSGTGDPAGVAAFAAHGEGVLPAPLAVLGLGGAWNAEVVPASRTGWAAVVALLLVVVLAASGARRWWRTEDDGVRRSLVVLAVVGVVVSLAGWAAPGLLAGLVGAVPGVGLLRDGTRWVALLAPLQAVLVGVGCAALVQRVRPAAVGLTTAVVLVLAPVALLPDAAWGGGGRLGAVAYPQEYADARAALDRAVAARPGGGGDVLLLPFSTYRAPAWNDGRRVLDPLGRYLRPDFLQSDDLFVSGRRIAGEDPRAARVARVLDRGGPPAEVAARLRAEGVGWVALDREAQRQVTTAVPSLAPPPAGEGTVVHAGPLLTLWELPGPVAEDVDAVPTAPVAAAWVAALVVLLGAAGRAVRGRRRGARRDTTVDA